MKRYNALFQILIFFVLPSVLFSMAGKKHVEGWIDILGIDDKHTETLIKFSNQIDIWQPSYNELNKKYSFSMNVGEHRLLFHWGFSAHPSTNEELVRRLDKCGINGHRRESFYNDLIKEQTKRNKEMIKLSIKIFKNRALSSNMASIIYDIHILQDYTTSNKAQLADERLIFSDIIRNMTTVFKQECFSVRSKLIKCKRRGDYIGFIKILEDELPSLIRGKFGRL